MALLAPCSTRVLRLHLQALQMPCINGKSATLPVCAQTHSIMSHLTPIYDNVQIASWGQRICIFSHSQSGKFMFQVRYFGPSFAVGFVSFYKIACLKIDFFFPLTAWLAGSQLPNQGLNPSHGSENPNG